jgi:preprotein translocase subunit SecE
VARQSRSRREGFQAPAQTSSSTSERARTRQRQVRPVDEVKSQTGKKRERQGGFRAFTSESVGELKKTEWPGRRQVVSATVVVLIAVAVVGAYLWALDEVFSRFVRDVLLNL